MPARPARVVPPLLLLVLATAPAAITADERDRFHAWFIAGPTFLLAPAREVRFPDIPVLDSRSSRFATDLAFPVGENPKGAIPQFQVGFAIPATPRVAVSFDVRRFEVEQRPAEPGRPALTRSVLAWGPGVRRTVGHGTARPFLQANVLVLTEEFASESSTSTGLGVGLGLLAGADLRVTDVLSIPIAANVLLGQAVNDVSTVGLTAGLAIHPSTGWSADPVTRAVEVAATQIPAPAIPAEKRSRVELGGGSSGTYQFDGEWDERFALGRASYLRSTKAGLDLSFDARFHRRSHTFRSYYGFNEYKSTERVVFAGPGIRFTRKEGWARRFFQANAWLSRETATIESGRSEFNRRRTAPGLGLALGFDVQLPRRLTMPLVARYDQVLRERDDDNRLISLEAGLAYAWSPTRP